MKKKLTPKSCGHKTVPLDHFQSYKIILESVDTILYPHTNLYPTLYSVLYHQQGPISEAMALLPAPGPKGPEGPALAPFAVSPL